MTGIWFIFIAFWLEKIYWDINDIQRNSVGIDIYRKKNFLDFFSIGTAPVTRYKDIWNVY